MELAVKTDQTEQISRVEQISQTEQIVLERHPALEEVIRPFAGVFRVKASLVERLKKIVCCDLTVSDKPVALEIDAFPPQAADLAGREIIVVLKQNFPVLEPDLCELESKMDQMDFSRICKDYLEKGADAAAEYAPGFGVSADCLELVTRLSLSALLEAMFSGRPIDQEKQAPQTHCPVCGSLPSISYLDRVPEEQSEFLTGGGGMKFFHCSLCGHDFKTHRHLCPVCDTKDPEQLRYYQADKESGERVDACLNCKTYLPSIDLRRAEGIMDLDTAAVGLLHLDILARKKGYQPLTWTLWNRME